MCQNQKLNIKVILILTCLLLQQAVLKAQSPSVDVEQGKRHAFLFPIGISAAIPEGDLKTQYGSFGIMNIGVFYRTKSNWLFGTDFSYFFGNNVKINPLNGLYISNNNMIGNDGLPSNVSRSFRGLLAPTLKVGKVFPMPIGKKADENSGIAIILGGGYMAHKIRYADESRNIPLLQSDVLKGYDRLSTGLGLQETLSYLYLSSSRTVNYTIALDFYQGFTQNRRVNYDLQKTLPAKRLDFMYAIRIGWVLPVYGQRSNEYYYY
jgi:hypothetical protein